MRRVVGILSAATAPLLLSVALSIPTTAETPPASGDGAPQVAAEPAAPTTPPAEPSVAEADAQRSPAGETSRGGLRAGDVRDTFIQAAGDAARDSQLATGVPASVTIAQAILESDWGRSTVGAANNYFGIKATSAPGPAGIVWAQTREFLSGAWVTVQAPFRAYNSMVESFVDHGLFLATSGRYARAFEHTDDPKTFAKLIHQAGYATDPGYADKLIGLMDRYDLYRFDLPPLGRPRPDGGRTGPQEL